MPKGLAFHPGAVLMSATVIPFPRARRLRHVTLADYTPKPKKPPSLAALARAAQSFEPVAYACHTCPLVAVFERLTAKPGKAKR